MNRFSKGAMHGAQISKKTTPPVLTYNSIDMDTFDSMVAPH
jgi:hypothetical protein